MDTSRIRTSHAKGETPPNTFDDFAWAREHEAELLDQYGECVLMVYEKQVLDQVRPCRKRKLTPSAICRRKWG